MENEKSFKIKWQEVLYLLIGYTVLIKLLVFNIDFFSHNKHSFGKITYSFAYLGVVEVLVIIGAKMLFEKINIIIKRTKGEPEYLYAWLITLFTTLLIILLICCTCDPLYKDFFVITLVQVGATLIYLNKQKN